ncbi:MULTISPECIES: type II secretion system protein [Methylophaga]|uniref:Prepilin-type N-terminal cleavage/methylation domain-containing protein n=1 Tax=Methylophaga aminisulfidivorans MP TaxID=1026882 RepID=F5T0X8_9GAMM|nr:MULTISPECIES: type II secretion system protein [Methylophaga]EGL53977.1 hypothetical protein MAMP_00412 [Methylophaga aminisulfidivorans MP]HIC46860.1 type II secretion system protein [Methylophaga sp.]
MKQQGFTLVELLIVLMVMAIIAVALLPTAIRSMDSYRVIATVEEMKAIAGFAELARQLPGGDQFNNSTTKAVASFLESYDVTNIGMSSTSDKKNHWSESYLITTTGKAAQVTTTVPLKGINPFEVIAKSSGTGTSLTYTHRVSPDNYTRLMHVRGNKHILYLE